MKDKFKYICSSVLIAVFCFLPSCSLDEKPTSFISYENFYQTKAQAEAGLRSCYIPLTSIYTYTYMIAIEGVTDLMYITSGTLDAQLNISPAQPRFGQTMWTQGYKGVMYCNAAINGIANSPLNEEVKNQLLAEGMIMRAYYYWFLTSTFGDVPFYTEHVANVEVLERVGRLGRMPAKDTRDYLIKELQEYIPYLEPTRTSDIKSEEVTIGKVGAAMGWMIMGKLAQWNKRWDVARDAMLELETIYGGLSQYSLDDIMFRRKNTPESIFEIQFTYTAGGLRKTTNVAAICTPSRSSKKGEEDVYDGVRIPEFGKNMTTWTALRPNSYYFESLQPRRGTDKRTRLNMAWSYERLNPETGQIEEQPFNSTGTRPWTGPKFWCPEMDNTADFNNQKVFRYADALLMQAENYMELEDHATAIRYLNMVRQRAGTPDYVFRNYDALKEEIQKERGRELLGEYQRKYDLVRWGIWYQATYDYTNYNTVKLNILPCHEYYPIPDIEVVYSGRNLDNKAYDAWM